MPDRDRDSRPGLPRLARVASAAGLACFAAAEATAQWYIEVGIGGNTSGDVVVDSRSNDRASICDEYINPRALAVPGCTAPDRGAGDGWRAPFDPGRGFSARAELGFRLSPRWRLAAAYARDATDFDQTVSSTDASGADFDKIGNELSIGEETLGWPPHASRRHVRIPTGRGHRSQVVRQRHGRTQGPVEALR